MVVLKLGAAGGHSHIPLEEHSYHSAAADPKREKAPFMKKKNSFFVCLFHLVLRKMAQNGSSLCEQYNF